ncbi:uncharacterized protein [Watersipora subatra]
MNFLSQSFRILAHARSPRLTCCLAFHKSADSVTLQRYKKLINKIEKRFDRISSQEYLVYRSSSSLFLTGSKLLVFTIPLFVYYKCAQTMYRLLVEKDTRHPSQIDRREEVTPIMAIFGFVISTTIGLAVLIMSRVFVRRIYYNDSTNQFRLVISNVLGNRSRTIGHHSLVPTHGMLITHRLDKDKLFIAEEGFVPGPYYHNLIS